MRNFKNCEFYINMEIKKPAKFELQKTHRKQIKPDLLSRV